MSYKENEVVATEENSLSIAVEQGTIGEDLKGSTRAGFSLTAEYLQMEKGEKRRETNQNPYTPWTRLLWLSRFV